MQLISTSKTQRRAVLLAAVMALSLVAMSAAFAGPAAAEVDTADRTIEETELAPGDSTTVTVEITMAEDGAPDLLEIFSSEFDSVEPTEFDPFPTVQDVSDSDVLIFWDEQSAGDTVTVEYEVTVPETADAGDEFIFIGEAGSDTGGETEITGDDTITVAEPEPDPFTVSNLDPVAANVDPGEELTVSADVTNTGDGAGESEVRLLVDDDEIETKLIDLEPGETESVPFTTTAPAEPGIYTHTIETDDDQLSGTLTVGDVEFSVSDLDPETATRAQGDTVDVSATITNTGDIGTEQDVRLVIDEETVDTQSIELATDDTESVTFDSVDTTALPPGEYQHGIATDQDSAQGTLTIEHSVVTYQDETGTVETEQLRNAISDWRMDVIETDLLRDVLAEWRQR